MARPPDYSQLRLRDRIKPGVRVLFVGINPGVRSALTGHHFAGYSNRFWKLLSESGLAPQPTTHLDDERFPEWGFGVTNLIARPSPGIGDLRPREYIEGWRLLDRKIRRYGPEVLALVGVTLYRAILPLIVEWRGPLHPAKLVARGAPLPRSAPRFSAGTRRNRARAQVIGEQPYTVHGARVFVLPNPSGRNANFTYAEMLDAFGELRRFAERQSRSRLDGPVRKR
jgi:double-stranded uracil-DNA glycosylase